MASRCIIVWELTFSQLLNSPNMENGLQLNRARPDFLIQKTVFKLLLFFGLQLQWINSAFTGSYTENQFCYHGIGLRQIRKLTVGQHIVTFDAVDFCRLYVTTMKAKTFQGYISILLDKFEDHYLIMFVLTSMTNFTDKCILPRTGWRTTEAPADSYFSS